MIKIKKAQSAMEFISLASFMLLLIVIFFAVASSKVLEAKDLSSQQIAEDISDIVYREIRVAGSLNDGYAREFTVPKKINAADYSIKIIDDRELIVNYLGYEYVKFLPLNVKCQTAAICSDLKRKNTISKDGGIVVIS